jgi:hypothetical protein
MRNQFPLDHFVIRCFAATSFYLHPFGHEGDEVKWCTSNFIYYKFRCFASLRNALRDQR